MPIPQGAIDLNPLLKDDQNRDINLTHYLLRVKARSW